MLVTSETFAMLYKTVCAMRIECRILYIFFLLILVTIGEECMIHNNVDVTVYRANPAAQNCNSKGQWEVAQPWLTDQWDASSGLAKRNLQLWDV
jgi:hypothetical protein